VGNFQRPPQNNPYSNTYNPGWRNHPNFSWTNQQNPRLPPPGYNQTHPPQQQQQKPSLEDLMSKFISTSKARFQNQEASIKNLETQVGQLAKMMSERAQGTLPSNTEPNPRGQLNAIFSENKSEAGKKQSETELKCLEERKSKTERGSENKLKFLEPKQKLESQEKGDIELLIYKLKQMKVNVPLLDALLCMPDHIQNLEDILQNKRKID